MLDVRVTSILNLNNVIIKLKHRLKRTSASSFLPRETLRYYHIPLLHSSNQHGGKKLELTSIKIQ